MLKYFCRLSVGNRCFKCLDVLTSTCLFYQAYKIIWLPGNIQAIWKIPTSRLAIPPMMPLVYTFYPFFLF